MRILLVSHDFLPAHPSGTEIYTHQLGLKLRELGHDVHVFTTEKDISRPNLSVRLREYRGLPVHELFNNLFYNDFRETWDCPPAARSFSLLLDDLKPDLVHFMHLMYLSVGCVEEVARRKIPVLFTLHDYWLQCPRFGQRIHFDGSICHTIDFERCGDCMSSFKFSQTRVERAAAKGIAALRSLTGVDVGPAARGLANRMRRPPSSEAQAETASGDVSACSGPAETASQAPELASMTASVRERDAALRQRLLPVVYRFIAPSRFLRERFVEWGIPPEQILFNRAGIDTSGFDHMQRAPGETLRLAYIGTLAPHKGVHILLEAWGKLTQEERARGELKVYGPHAHNPGYLRLLQRLAESGGARLMGGLDPAGVRAALPSVDLLVVPSVWYENSPLIILESLAARTPLAVSRLGGMAELVEPGVSGYHFDVGDTDQLAALFRRLLEDPSELDQLYAGALPVKSIEADASELEALYFEALEATRGGG